MKRIFCFGFFLLPFLGFGQVVDTAVVRREVDSLLEECDELAQKGHFEEALKLIGVTEKKIENIFGQESAEYAMCMHDYGRLFHKWRKLNEAIPYYISAIDIRQRILGEFNLEYSWSLNNLANIYRALGEYEEAEPLYLESKNIREHILGKFHPDYAWSLNNLSLLYHNQGKFEKAEQLQLEALSIREKTLGKDSPDYAVSLLNLSGLYFELGEYEKAEHFGITAKNLRAKILGTESLQYANIVNNLGGIYLANGDYEKAKSAFFEAKNIREKVLGKESQEYAFSLDNLALTYVSTYEYDKGEQLLLEALDILEKKLGKEHPEYAICLNGLGNIYFAKNEYEKCLPLYIEANTILGKSLGVEHPFYAASLNNLGNYYLEIGEFEKAKFLYLKSISIREMVFGKENIHYVQSLYNLARLYNNTGQNIDSEKYFAELSIISKHILNKSKAYLPNQELERKIALYKDKNDAFLSFNNKATSTSFHGEAYNNSLFYKGLSLEASIRLEREIQNAPDSIRDIHSRWKGYNRRLSAELSKPIAERKNVERLDSLSNALEKVLLYAAPAFAEAQRQVQWSEVHAALQPNEAAIEIIHYCYHDKKITDSTLYAALLLLPNDTAPRFIPLCEERQLDAIVYKPSGPRANYLQNLYSSPRADGLASLYQLIWAPIDKVLKENGVKTVYYAPSGLLHRLNLAAIAPDKSGQTLADRYHLIPVASTRQLVTDHSESSTLTSAIIYGGVRYEMDSAAIAQANMAVGAAAQDTNGGLFRYATRGGERADNWDSLPGAEREARYLYDLLTKRGVNATLRLGYAATEESMKQIGHDAPSPSLLHIGTHGFFFPDPKDTTRRRANFGDDAPVFKISEHPLIRSGLKLAGSKYAWENKRPMGGMEDGILTAYEVSQMNLSNTQLVVLSACETGLGDIKGNEGVYGLQRAFRIAGAKNVLMSLWKVPDEATEKLMTRFYQNWLEQKMSLRTAFESAQKWLRGQKGYENPYYWAGFVLIGEL